MAQITQHDGLKYTSGPILHRFSQSLRFAGICSVEGMGHSPAGQDAEERVESVGV